jgi:hypothetical protein
LSAAVVAIAFAAFPPQAAAGWQKPVDVHQGPAGWVRVGNDGTAYSAFAEGVAKLGWSATRWRRCRLEGVSFHSLKYEDPRWAGNPSGALVAGWQWGKDRDTAPRYVSTAAAGGCFGERQKVPARAGRSSGVGVAIGRGGTALASWVEGPENARRLVFATGRAGAPLKRRNVVLQTRGNDVEYGHVQPTFVRRDRVQWTWFTTELVPGDPDLRRQRIWSARGGPDGGAVGAPRVTYSIKTADYSRLYDALNSVLTDGRGGEVALGVDAPPGHMAFLVRKPGERFRKQSFPVKTEFRAEAGAINPSGDVVYAGAAGDEVYAVYRRRDGHIVGPVHLSPGGGTLRTDGRPVAAIDDAGRAVIVWSTANGYLYDTTPERVRAVMTDRDGRFRKPALISGTEGDNLDPHVGVSPGGRVVASWRRLRHDSSGEVTSAHTFVARGGTPR